MNMPRNPGMSVRQILLDLRLQVTLPRAAGLLSPPESLQSPSHVSPAEAAGVITVLKDKSAVELWNLVSDKEAYQHFFLSLDQVKIQNNCKVIRTAELAASQEKLNELEKWKEETLETNFPASLLQRIQEAMNKSKEESENRKRL